MLRMIKKILNLSGEYGKYIKLSMVFSFFSGIFASMPLMSIFYFFYKFEENNYSHIEKDTIWKCVGIFAISIIGGIITRYFTYRFQGVSGYYMVAKERLSIGDHLRRVPMSFFNKNSLGDVTMAITSDLQYVESQAPQFLDWIINGTITSVISAITLTIFNFKLGMIFIIALIVALLICNAMQNIGKYEAAGQKERQSKAANSTLEYIRGIATFKMYRMSGKSTDKIKNSYREYGDACAKTEFKLIPLGGLFLGVLKAACGIIIIAAPYMALTGETTIATAAMMIIASFNIFTPVENLGVASGMLRMMEANLDRIDKVKQFEVIDADGKNIELKSFDIDVNNVSFSYDNRGKKEDIDEEKDITIKNVSFKVKPSSMTAIVGASGCGKTTMTRLVSRFFDVQAGSIKIGGTDIKEHTCDSLLKNISMVFQNVYLFNDTIINNIKFGNPNATMEEVVDAAIKARCHEFINDLPEGYDTMVGEGGAALSGGEKQRISIARAILKDAPIVLLDEATANIDPENEVYIQGAISELVKNKTLIVIAHRLNTIKDADQIVVMNNGEISDIGTHKELIKKEGIYKCFWDIRQNANAWQVRNV
ncbi:MAG: ABC transporter ATP-binding protein [Clostridium beijerinckii]|nr:ABC transporter ATP-binding protein [Clostridium beijerinckii]